MTACGADFYDDVIANRDSPHLLPATVGPWGELYNAVARILANYWERPRVVDLGCGTGRLAELIGPHTGLTVTYRGLDFSRAMLTEAARHLERFENPETSDTCWFEYFDLAGHWPELLRNDPDVTYIALEVLEHLDDDLALLAKLPEGADVILSVPSTDSYAHVRHFPNLTDAIDRYATALDLISWERVWTPGREGFWHLITAEAIGAT